MFISGVCTILNDIVPIAWVKRFPLSAGDILTPFPKLAAIVIVILAITDTIIGSRSTPTEEVHRTVLRNGFITVDSIIRCCITDEIPLVGSKAPSPGFTEVGSRSLQVTFCEGDLVATLVNRELTAQSSGRHSAARVQCCKSSLCIEQGLIVTYQQFLVSSQSLVRSACVINRIARSELQRNRTRDGIDLSLYYRYILQVCIGSLSRRQRCVVAYQLL